MAGMFSKPKKPPKPIDPNIASKKSEREAASIAERKRRQRGYESTVTSSGMGVQAPAPTKSTYLIGA